jgi:ABC-type multidrug transport system fused ATPase/permease subunit
MCFDHVSYTYPGRSRDVLHDLSLELAPGERVALVGHSGAGKTTVAALALRLADPTAGTLRCGTTDLRDVDPRAWQAQVAWVPQGSKLFTGTLAENIRLADPDARQERVVQALRDAGLGDLLSELPDGLATAIGDGGRRFSAGQRQRIALARAFLRDAPLVVLDEPTANLDADSAHALGDAIERLSDGRTVLLITHDEELAANADRVIRLAAPHVEVAEPELRQRPVLAAA